MKKEEIIAKLVTLENYLFELQTYLEENDEPEFAGIIEDFRETELLNYYNRVTK